MKSRKQKPILFESQLTHEGWAVIRDGHLLCAFQNQRQAENAARALAQRSADSHNAAEVRLFKSDGRLRSARIFEAQKP